LKAEIRTDERIEDHFDKERDAEEIEARRVASNQFAYEIKERCKPAPLHRRESSDKEEIDVDEDQESGEFCSVGEEEAEKKRAKRDENGKVEAGDG
jgi:hypothetical protein